MPTIKQIEDLINSGQPIEILPTGEIVLSTRKEEEEPDTPLTFRTDLGGEY